jgi:hypothetical protein
MNAAAIGILAWRLKEFGSPSQLPPAKAEA